MPNQNDQPVSFDLKGARRVAEATRTVERMSVDRTGSRSLFSGLSSSEQLFVRVVGVPDEGPGVDVVEVGWNETDRVWFDLPYETRAIVRTVSGDAVTEPGVYSVRSRFASDDGLPILWVDAQTSSVFKLVDAVAVPGTEPDSPTGKGGGGRWIYTARLGLVNWSGAYQQVVGLDGDPVEYRAVNLYEIGSGNAAGSIGQLANDPQIIIGPVPYGEAIGRTVHGVVTLKPDLDLDDGTIVPVVEFYGVNEVSYECPDGAGRGGRDCDCDGGQA